VQKRNLGPSVLTWEEETSWILGSRILECVCGHWVQVWRTGFEARDWSLCIPHP